MAENVRTMQSIATRIPKWRTCYCILLYCTCEFICATLRATPIADVLSARDPREK